MSGSNVVDDKRPPSATGLPAPSFSRRAQAPPLKRQSAGAARRGDVLFASDAGSEPSRLRTIDESSSPSTTWSGPLSSGYCAPTLRAISSASARSTPARGNQTSRGASEMAILVEVAGAVVEGGSRPRLSRGYSEGDDAAAESPRRRATTSARPPRVELLLGVLLAKFGRGRAVGSRAGRARLAVAPAHENALGAPRACLSPASNTKTREPRRAVDDGATRWKMPSSRRQSFVGRARSSCFASTSCAPASTRKAPAVIENAVVSPPSTRSSRVTLPYLSRRVPSSSAEAGRGGAAAATWIQRGGGAAAATRMIRGGGDGRNETSQISARPETARGRPAS